MTNKILPTDIELATRLLAAGRPEATIVAALVHRGIETATAAQVVADLRSGRKVMPQIPSGLEIAPGRRSRSKKVGLQSQPAPPPRAPEPTAAPGPPVSRSAGEREKSPSLWILAAIPICLVAIILGVLLANRLRRGGDGAVTKIPRGVASARGRVAPTEARTNGPPTTAPASGAYATTAHGSGLRPEPSADARNSGEAARQGLAQTKAAGATPQPSSPGLVLNLQPDGLRIGGNLVTPGNALMCISKVLGEPTRSSPAGQPDTMIYAYDDHGLLIYSAKGTGKDSIVLDCDASGGANGTSSPFTGSLQVEDQVIRPDTDSKTLAAMPKLGFSNPAAGGGILSGRYSSLDLAFAYLKTPRRLSLIEIDLK